MEAFKKESFVKSLVVHCQMLQKHFAPNVEMLQERLLRDEHLVEADLVLLESECSAALTDESIANCILITNSAVSSVGDLDTSTDGDSAPTRTTTTTTTTSTGTAVPAVTAVTISTTSEPVNSTVSTATSTTACDTSTSTVTTGVTVVTAPVKPITTVTPSKSPTAPPLTTTTTSVVVPNSAINNDMHFERHPRQGNIASTYYSGDRYYPNNMYEENRYEENMYEEYGNQFGSDQHYGKSWLYDRQYSEERHRPRRKDRKFRKRLKYSSSDSDSDSTSTTSSSSTDSDKKRKRRKSGKKKSKKSKKKAKKQRKIAKSDSEVEGDRSEKEKHEVDNQVKERQTETDHLQDKTGYTSIKREPGTQGGLQVHDGGTRAADQTQDNDNNIKDDQPFDTFASLDFEAEASISGTQPFAALQAISFEDFKPDDTYDDIPSYESFIDDPSPLLGVDTDVWRSTVLMRLEILEKSNGCEPFTFTIGTKAPPKIPVPPAGCAKDEWDYFVTVRYNLFAAGVTKPEITDALNTHLSEISAAEIYQQRQKLVKAKTAKKGGKVKSSKTCKAPVQNLNASQLTVANRSEVRSEVETSRLELEIRSYLADPVVLKGLKILRQIGEGSAVPNFGGMQDGALSLQIPAANIKVETANAPELMDFKEFTEAMKSPTKKSGKAGGPAAVEETSNPMKGVSTLRTVPTLEDCLSQTEAKQKAIREFNAIFGKSRKTPANQKVWQTMLNINRVPCREKGDKSEISPMHILYYFSKWFSELNTLSENKAIDAMKLKVVRYMQRHIDFTEIWIQEFLQEKNWSFETYCAKALSDAFKPDGVMIVMISYITGRNLSIVYGADGTIWSAEPGQNHDVVLCHHKDALVLATKVGTSEGGSHLTDNWLTCTETAFLEVDSAEISYEQFVYMEVTRTEGGSRSSRNSAEKAASVSNKSTRAKPAGPATPVVKSKAKIKKPKAEHKVQPKRATVENRQVKQKKTVVKAATAAKSSNDGPDAKNSVPDTTQPIIDQVKETGQNNSDNSVTANNGQHATLMSQSTGETVIKCVKCDRFFVTREAFQDHAKEHADFLTCKICEKMFDCLASLRLHMGSHQSVPDNSERRPGRRIKIGKKLFPCPKCGEKGYTRKSDVKRHLERSCKKNPNIVINCRWCLEQDVQTKSTGRQGLINHINAEHQGRGEFLCDKCHVTFETEGQLHSHEVAKLCLKRFKRK